MGAAGQLVPLLPAPHLHLTLQLLRAPLQEASPLRTAHWHCPAWGCSQRLRVRLPPRCGVRAVGVRVTGMGSQGPKSQGLGHGPA